MSLLKTVVGGCMLVLKKQQMLVPFCKDVLLTLICAQVLPAVSDEDERRALRDALETDLGNKGVFQSAWMAKGNIWMILKFQS